MSSQHDIISCRSLALKLNQICRLETVNKRNTDSDHRQQLLCHHGTFDLHSEKYPRKCMLFSLASFHLLINIQFYISGLQHILTTVSFHTLTALWHLGYQVMKSFSCFVLQFLQIQYDCAKIPLLCFSPTTVCIYYISG